MGLKAAQLLLDMMRTGQPMPQQVRLKPDLIVRSSTDMDSKFSLADYLMDKVEKQAIAYPKVEAKELARTA